MPLFIQKIPHLLFGVSQRPKVQRDPSHLQSCDNWLARATYGLAKRPPFQYLGKLTADITGIAGAAIFSIQRDSTNRFRVVIKDGTLAVYDMVNSGVQIPVEDRTSDTYLDDAGGEGFRHVTIGDATFITNRGVTVDPGAVKSASQNVYALVTVEQADFSTNYAITLNNTTYRIKTVDQGDATARGQINTDQIAEELFNRITSGIENIWTTQLFRTVLLGSTIFIESRNNIDFPINVTDGLSDNGLRLIKGQIQDVEDLVFTRAPNGTKVNVTGDPATDKDDFWLEYDSTIAAPDGGDAVGIWTETTAPETPLRLDSDTMPHRLSFNSSKIEGERVIESLPPVPTVEDFFQTDETGGWDEDELGGGILEETDDIIKDHLLGRRRLIPGADGVIRQLVKIIYDIDTSSVEYGKDVIVNLIHRTSGGTETTIARKRYEPGQTLTGQSILAVSNDESEGTWLATDRFKLTLEYGDNVAPAAGESATLTMVGEATGTKADLTPRYRPIRVKGFGGIKVTMNGISYREGIKVGLDLNFNAVLDQYVYTVPAGGETAAQVATGLAALIDTTGTTDYTAAVLSGSQFRIFVTGNDSADPAFVIATITFVTDKAIVAGLILTLNEFVGETLVNITDGSSGAITANTTDGVFTATLTGGIDNTFSPGDRVKVVGTGGYFVFESVTYDERRVGDEDTNPWPSFKDATVTDVFFYRNRLGFVTGRGVVLSENGDFLNFFRNSIQSLLDGDVIDVESSHGDVAIFHSAIPWNNTLFLWTGNAQYELSGIPVLSPKTVRLDVVSRYSNTPNVRPEVVGPKLYFAHGQTGSGKIMEWQPPVDDATKYLARDITVDVPTYIPGEVLDLAGDFAHGVLAVLADGDQSSIYIWSFTPKGDGTNIHETWQRWTLPTDSVVRQMDFSDGKLAIVYSASDGVFIEQADIDQSIDGGSESFVDRRIIDIGVFDDLDSFNALATVAYRSEEVGDDVQGGRVNTWPSSPGASDDFTMLGDLAGNEDGPAIVVAGTPEGTDYADWFNDVFFSERLMFDDTGGNIDLSGEMTLFTVVRFSSAATSDNYGMAWMSAQTPDESGTADMTFRWGLHKDTDDKWKIYWDREDSEAPFQGIGSFLYPKNPLVGMPLDTWVVTAIRVSDKNDGGTKDHLNVWTDGEKSNTAISKPRLASTGGFLGLGGHKIDIDSGVMQMDQAEFLVFDTALTESQIILISDLLTKKHLDSTHQTTSEVDWPYEENDEGITETVDGVFYAGVPFTARARLSPIYYRGADGRTETAGRTQVRELQVEYNNTEDLKIEVTPQGRAKYTHTVSESEPTEGSKRVPVLSRGETTVIELVSDGTGDARINSIDIELQHTNRSRRA